MMKRSNCLRPVITVALAFVLGVWGICFTSFAKETTILSPEEESIVFSLFTGLNFGNLDYEEEYSKAYYDENEGIKAGVLGFSTKKGDLLEVVKLYESLKPGNGLTKYIPAMEAVVGTSAVTDLSDEFIKAFNKAGEDEEMITAQKSIAQELYMSPASIYAQRDGLSLLGQFIYMDAIVNHGLSEDETSFDGIRIIALKNAELPINGGDEGEYLKAFLFAEKNYELMMGLDEKALRVDNILTFVDARNYELVPPIKWGDNLGIYYIAKE